MLTCATDVATGRFAPEAVIGAESTFDPQQTTKRDPAVSTV